MNGKSIIVLFALFSISFSQLFNCTETVHCNAVCGWEQTPFIWSNCNSTFPQTNDYSAAIQTNADTIVNIAANPITVHSVVVGLSTNANSTQTLQVNNVLTAIIDVENCGKLVINNNVNSVATANGGQIVFTSGTFTGSMTINKGASLNFNQGDQTVMGNIYAEGPVAFTQAYVIAANTDNVINCTGNVAFNQGGAHLGGAGAFYLTGPVAFSEYGNTSTTFTFDASSTTFGDLVTVPMAVFQVQSTVHLNNFVNNGMMVLNQTNPQVMPTVSFASLSNAIGGTIELHQGNLIGRNSVTAGLIQNNGTFKIAATPVQFTASNFTFSNNGYFLAEVPFNMTTTFENGALVTINADVAVMGDIYHKGGMINGTGRLFGNNTLYWSNGNIDINTIAVRHIVISEATQTIINSELQFTKSLELNGNFQLEQPLVVAYHADFTSHPGSLVNTSSPHHVSITNQGTIYGSVNLQYVDLTSYGYLGTQASPLDSLVVTDANLVLGPKNKIHVRISSLNSPIIIQRVSANASNVQLNSFLDGHIHIYLASGFNPSSGDKVNVVQSVGTVTVNGSFIGNLTVDGEEGSNINSCQWDVVRDGQTVGNYYISFHDCHAPSPVTPAPSSSSSSKTAIIVVVVVAVVVVVVVIIVAVVLYRRKHHVAVAEKQRLI